MDIIILKVIPILLIFLLGILLKRLSILNDDSADSFLKFVFHVSFPASILISIPRMVLTSELLFLPLTAIAIIILSYFAARAAGAFFNLSGPALGVFLVGSMIINTGFTYPFIIAVFGQEGFARAALFDFGNCLIILTFVYYVAVKYGRNGETKIINKFLGSTPLWALSIAVFLNLTGTSIPVMIDDFLQLLGNTLIPLFMISLGLRFSLKVVNFKALFAVISIRMFFGLLLGIGFVNIFGIEGLSRSVVLISSAAPVGFNTLMFATLEDLDKEFAASIVSFSILIGIVLTTIMLFFLGSS
ncbi:MAG: AEC family transporter [Firmicutes bacterium HGW-Firmicutes-14]|jgi:hypothetical protein|nr:MAG: AEC family transporter [Firmicutes bacterium HGW-Firmicutes-14]